jgi:hypothetical protein
MKRQTEGDTKMATDISSTDDIIDLSDVTERVEELEDAKEAYLGDVDEMSEEERAAVLNAWEESDEGQELQSLLALLKALENSGGGDHQWRGTWYPGSLIRDSHFQDYARQLAEDIGAIPDDAKWPCTCIDWDQAASELKVDYSALEFDNVTYWYR